MIKQISIAALISGALLAPAFAQTATTPMAPAPAAAMSASGDGFVKQQEINQWRASKLVGVSVMGPDQKSIGKIADVLVDHDGNAQTIVVSVGGFLGMGAKDVGVPFKTMHWKTEGRAAAVEPPASNSAMGSATAPGTAPAAPAPAPKVDAAAVEANQGYPDVATLDMTKEQLQNAPDFKYAPDPTATHNN